MDKRIIIGIVVAVIIIVAFVYMQQEKPVVPQTITNNAGSTPVAPTSDVATPIVPTTTGSTAPPPTIALLSDASATSDPTMFWVGRDGSMAQGIDKTRDGDVATLWNPYFDASATSRASSATYDFGARKFISRVVLKSGLYDTNLAQDWASVQITVDGVVLGSFQNNNVKIPMPIAGNGSHYTENSINIGKTCQTIKLSFADDLHRLREVQFYGY